MYISIHAPTRGATKKAILQREKQAISIHAPTRGATIPNIDIPDVAGFQSTLPREERPRALLIYIPDYTISIHAPTRGATKSTALLKLIRKISIHAPTRGATRTRKEFRLLVQNFNPRSHERSDVLIKAPGYA